MQFFALILVQLLVVSLYVTQSLGKKDALHINGALVNLTKQTYVYKRIFFQSISSEAHWKNVENSDGWRFLRYLSTSRNFA